MQETPKRRALLAVPLVLLGATMPLFSEQSTLTSIRGASLKEMVPSKLVQTKNESFLVLNHVIEEAPKMVR